ncbi:23S rRNA (adenine(2030)-N(6))-methyltransferase RlmJ [Rhodoferax sp.]|uniref:23S rRNA (adenine(2030)-N(6))-methyltransferase RlmJ n=1 Tax=Rhodoferax sp. TaxID=50421 RepID=UPI00277018B6|nr:23S rRNA (adenine(2030)-N(6))-methyltransferase RlmJ [Rhodoferax sp.]
MFSYRHAFHAGNHADVLKHTALMAILQHLTQKDTALLVVDTHAGAGLYRLDGDYAQTSGEADEGLLRLTAKPAASPAPGKKPPAGGASKAATAERAPALQAYLDMVGSFNAKGRHRVYPGSPFIIHQLLREQDRLKLFELHPTDARTLLANIGQLNAGRQIEVFDQDGFEGLKKFLPPPSRRALVLCDPSYEIKSDYPRVVAMVSEALQRFATGTYMVWYPLIPRPESHDLPRKLKNLAIKAGKGWLNASLNIKSNKLGKDAAGEVVRPGLSASGIFVINPPHTLKAALKEALPQMVALLGQDQHASFELESG